jgi:hypothetical protein
MQQKIMKRKTLLFSQILPAMALMTACACFGEDAPAQIRHPAGPPWRMIYNNDTTNILTCPSPFHKDGEDRFTDDMVRATVDEAAVPGVDAMALMPGLGWIPWWPSKIYPMAEPEAWFKTHFGVSPHNVIDDYLLAGGDYIKVFVDECHAKGVAALISYRMNDGHSLERADGGAKPSDVSTVSRFYVEHPELRLEPKSTGYGMGIHNWLKPAAPAYKLSLIAEVIGLYDLDGLELDFLRHSRYFPSDTPMPERVAVMTQFIREVRAALDRSERNGKHRWLGVRVYQNADHWNDTGFDPAAFRAAGVDYFNLSNYYNTSQQSSIPEVRLAAPDAKIYLEETHSPQNWPLIAAYDGFDLRRNTTEMLESTARLAYERGADGISLFNFVYYRPYGPARDRRGPFNDPPFDVLPALANPTFLKEMPSYFYLIPKDQALHLANKQLADVPFQPGEEETYTMDMVPFSCGAEGRLRLQVMTTAESLAGEGMPAEKTSRGHWTVTLNGRELEPADDCSVSYPFPTIIVAGFGHAEQYLGWRVPAGTVLNGLNHVKVTFVDGPSNLRLRWIEVFSHPSR